MNSGTRILTLLIIILSTSSAMSQNYHCISKPLDRPLLTAFYYPDNAIISPNAMNVFKNSISHLDVLEYSASFYGLMSKNNSYILADIAKQNLITLHQWLEKNHLQTKIFLSLGHWSAEMHQVFLHEKARKNFIDALIQVVKNKDYQLSGIDLDWENFFSPRRAEIKGFPIFVKQLRQALDSHGLKQVCLTLDLPASTTFAKLYPTPKNWLPHIDWAHLMAYEFYGIDPSHSELDATLGEVTAPYAGNTPHYANLSIASSLDYYVNQTGIPKNKLVITVPFYGNMNYIHDADKKNQHGLRQKVIDDRSIVTLDYSSIYSDFGIYGKSKKEVSIYQYTFQQPANVKDTHAYWIIKLITESTQVGKSYKFVSYPDPISIKEITQFVQKEGYLGLSAWQLDYDLPFENPHSLLKTMYAAIHVK